MPRPEEDRYLRTERELQDEMAVLLGGRAAELLVFQEASSGAANDLSRATDIARSMVTELGMSQALGPVRYAEPAGSGYLNSRFGLRQELSSETASMIDQEVRKLVESAQVQAMDLLRAHSAALHRVAETLIENETIAGDQVVRIAEEMSD
jgi:cell division protease FtsH